jgi:uncharacterized membrane protein (UPF0127 family)
MKRATIQNSQKPGLIIQAARCDNFISQFKGLMFRPSIGEFDGLLFWEPNESRINTAIHMLFMHFDIAVVWANRQGIVVDVQYAKAWHLAYVPRIPACITLELHANRVVDFKIGDQLIIENT